MRKSSVIKACQDLKLNCGIENSNFHFMRKDRILPLHYNFGEDMNGTEAAEETNMDIPKQQLSLAEINMLIQVLENCKTSMTSHPVVEAINISPPSEESEEKAVEAETIVKPPRQLGCNLLNELLNLPVHLCKLFNKDETKPVKARRKKSGTKSLNSSEDGKNGSTQSHAKNVEDTGDQINGSDEEYKVPEKKSKVETTGDSSTSSEDPITSHQVTIDVDTSQGNSNDGGETVRESEASKISQDLVDETAGQEVVSNAPEEPKECSQAFTMLGRSRVRLNNPKMYTRPNLSHLDKISTIGTSCLVTDFVVGHQDFGDIQFDGLTDVYDANLDEIFFFTDGSLVVYPLPLKLPPIGQGFNRSAIVTLKNIWPWKVDPETNGKINILEKVGTVAFCQHLKDQCIGFNGQFISYDPAGIWVFKVPGTLPKQ